MNNKRYNKVTFVVTTAAGKQYNFNCYTFDTVNGFNHVAKYNNSKTQTAYLNRTWEKYDYQTVLLKAAAKIDQNVLDAVRNESFTRVYNN